MCLLPFRRGAPGIPKSEILGLRKELTVVQETVNFFQFFVDGCRRQRSVNVYFGPPLSYRTMTRAQLPSPATSLPRRDIHSA